jgi:hypothetical protein
MSDSDFSNSEIPVHKQPPRKIKKNLMKHPFKPNCSLFEMGLRPVDESRLHDLLLDFFVAEGLFEEAVAFASESNQVLADNETKDLKIRAEIKSAIECGPIEHALHLLSQMDNSFLSQYPNLHSNLTVMRFVDAFLQGGPNGLTTALSLAKREFPLLTDSRRPEAFEELESAMALLIFPPGVAPSLPPMLKPYADESGRKDLANKVNRAILASRGTKTHSTLSDAMDELAETQTKLRASGDTETWPVLDIDTVPEARI